MSTPAEATPPRPIRFLHRGQVHEVSGVPATTTVLQWLRESAHCTGTKEGCAEGDCGACTVVVGHRDEATGAWQQQTVNACIQFLPTLDGHALLTVEDLQPTPSEPLHPCQQALVECHGSQCGFCTPGFVMSMWDQYQRHDAAPTRADMADALAGNLCRCTGYRPILDAAERMYDAPRTPFNPEPLLAALARLQAQSGANDFAYEGPDPAAPGSMTRFYAPASLSSFAALRAAWPNARVLAGGTDIGLWVNKQFRALGDILYVGRVQELTRIAIQHTPSGQLSQVYIGAAASLETAWATLTEHMPPLREIWKRFASPPVRHAGTLGGNLANGSPIGDGGPVLLALGASLILRQGDNTREVPLNQFYLDYMKNDLRAGEFIEGIVVPLPQSNAGDVVRAYKVSKRRDSDISALCAAFMIQLDQGIIRQARLGWGGMAATAKRATQTEQALIGQAWNEATLQAAQAVLAQELTPLTDLRASDTYRRTVAANLLTRFWHETRPDAPLHPAQTQVWPTPV